MAAAAKGLTRGDLLRRGAAGAFAVGMFGGLAERSFGFAGPLKYKGRDLKGDLKILQWAHFVPDYDKWFDSTYTKQWGQKNDVNVTVDHINNALLPSAAASEVAAQSGHDLVQFLFPPSALEKQVIPVNDLVQEVTRKDGKPNINNKGTIEALKVMRDIFQNGESDEVFAWTAASNNQGFLAGRLSITLNAISIARSAEASGNTALSDDTWIAPIPAGPVRRLGNEHVMPIYFIWKFAKNKAAAQKY